MTVKLIGAACVALAAGSTLRTMFLERRREDQLLQHLTFALDTIAREIRWKHRPIGDIFDGLSKDAIVGPFFTEIKENMDRKIPLQLAWDNAFSTIALGKDALLNVDLNGDEGQLVAALERGAETLRQMMAQRRKNRPEQIKLCTAAALSMAGGLILLLL